MQSANIEAVTSAMQALQAAWNTADADTFANAFTADADFVDIRGAHHHGRTSIAKGHAAIFASVYKGSSITYRVTAARYLTDQVILGHVVGTLTASPAAPAGVQVAQASVVLVHASDGWWIAAFHNTPLEPPKGQR
jgi:uncharacterized protein (TIGR02246 family)